MTQSCCPLDFDPIPSIIQHSGYNWTLNTSITFASSYLLLIETLIMISNLLTWLNLLCWIKRMLVVQQRVGGSDLPFVICTKRVLFNHIFYTNLWEYLYWYVNLATDIALMLITLPYLSYFWCLLVENPESATTITNHTSWSSITQNKPFLERFWIFLVKMNLNDPLLSNVIFNRITQPFREKWQ